MQNYSLNRKQPILPSRQPLTPKVSFQQNQLKKIASQAKSTFISVKKNLNDSELDYMDRLIALKAANDLAYLDSNTKNKDDTNEAIYKELDFIRYQVETVKNELKLCDSISSGRIRSNNPSVLSSHTSDHMQQRVYNFTTVGNSYALPPKCTSSSPRSRQSHSSINKNTIESSISLSRQLKLLKEQQFRDLHRQQQQKSAYSSKLTSQRNRYSQYQYQQQEHKQIVSNNYIFCLFTRLNNSTMLNLVDKQKIRVKQEDKCGNKYTFKYYILKNPILTSLDDLSQLVVGEQITTMLLMGGKSTSKQKIVMQIIKLIVSQFDASDDLQLYMNCAIHGSIVSQEAYSSLPYELRKLQAETYQTEAYSKHPEVLLESVGNLFKQIKRDPYYMIKEYYHNQISITQQGKQRKFLMNIISKEISCVKAYQINLKVNLRPYQFHIITTNFISTRLETVPPQAHSLLEEGCGSSLVLRALEQLGNADSIKIFCINPLRYRLQDSLQVLSLFEQQNG